MEQLATVFRGSTVEEKSELVKIGIQLLNGKHTLMGTQQPSFQQRGHPLYTWQQSRRCHVAGINYTRSVLEPFLPQARIGFPSICDNHGARLNCMLHKRN